MMTPQHPRWEEFYRRLEGPEGCDFKESTPGDPATVTWKCKGGHDKSMARAVLAEMGFNQDEIDWSCAYFNLRGGCCDCEILFNVESASLRDINASDRIAVS